MSWAVDLLGRKHGRSEQFELPPHQGLGRCLPIPGQLNEGGPAGDEGGIEAGVVRGLVAQRLDLFEAAALGIGPARGDPLRVVRPVFLRAAQALLDGGEASAPFQGAPAVGKGSLVG